MQLTHRGFRRWVRLAISLNLERDMNIHFTTVGLGYGWGYNLSYTVTCQLGWIPKREDMMTEIERQEVFFQTQWPCRPTFWATINRLITSQWKERCCVESNPLPNEKCT